MTTDKTTKKKKTAYGFQEMKNKGQRITFLTCYDYFTAQCCEEAGLDMLLVGDSLRMCIYGYTDTVFKTADVDPTDQMIAHTEAVRRGAPNTFIVGDMCFGSYQQSISQAIHNAGKFFEKAGVDAVKLEGGTRIIDKVKGIIDAGMAVMGHIGFTPQTSDVKRKSPKVNGRTAEEAKRLIQDALALQEAGVFSILLEAIPPEVAKIITERCEIPILGIGAGIHTDGQLLISHDVLGIFTAFAIRFVKKYEDLHQRSIGAFKRYVVDVKERRFPEAKHCYRMYDGELEKLLAGDKNLLGNKKPFGGSKIRTI